MHILSNHLIISFFRISVTLAHALIDGMPFDTPRQESSDLFTLWPRSSDGCSIVLLSD